MHNQTVKATLSWKLKDVLALMRVAAEAKAHREDFVTGRTEPALLLVKDNGVYLMPNCVYESGTASTHGDVLYAKGFDPSKDEGWWDRASEELGGDDFGETIELSGLSGAEEALRDGFTRFVVKMRPDDFMVSFSK